ncbi:helix-turn-helix domain-containing protein, partial [Streptomyces clavuligerus]|uniref:helix-turn-helix domain-containing protein n=1 Tax=Streptomyces clavuligerus TaxID=1901 RepID=UPI0018D08618
MSASNVSTSSGEPEGPAGAGPDPESVVLDAKGLRALAHPLRVRLLGQLRRHGPSTATRLAERLGVNSGTASYHVRRLGAAGFVEEDTERGNARERWWRSVHRTTSLTDWELADREPEATLAYLHSVASGYARRTRQVLDGLDTMPRAWRQSLDISDWLLRLTPEEATALGEELQAVVDRYRQDLPGAATPEGAERVSVILHLLPEPGTVDIAADAVADPAGPPDHGNGDGQ